MNNINIYRFSCLRCHHQWSSKQDRPRVCPKCKSPYWDTSKETDVTEILTRKEDEVYPEIRKRIEHNKWGRWKYNTSTHCLGIQKDVGGYMWIYEVDLEQCNTGAKLLDWIYQVQGKTWISPDDVADLVYAVDDLLCFVQSKLCSMGKNREYDVANHLTKNIDPILAK